jgi:hypothetical protein
MEAYKYNKKEKKARPSCKLLCLSGQVGSSEGGG